MIADLLGDIIDLMEEGLDYDDRPMMYDALVDIFDQYSKDEVLLCVGRSAQFDDAVRRKYPETDESEE